MNEIIELHDSEVKAIRQQGGNLILVLGAVIHSSEGRPGSDAGRTFTQEAELIIEDARVLSKPKSQPLWILSGQLTVGEEAFEDVPLPFDRSGDVRVQLSGVEGVLSAAGRRVRLTLTGVRRHLEDFPSQDETL